MLKELTARLPPEAVIIKWQSVVVAVLVLCHSDFAGVALPLGPYFIKIPWRVELGEWVK